MSERGVRERPEDRWPRWALVGVGILAATAAGLRLTSDAGALLGWIVATIPVLLLARTAGIRGAAFGAAAGLAALLAAEVVAGPLTDAQQAWQRFAGGAALYVAFALGAAVGLAIRDRTWLTASGGSSLLLRMRALLPGRTHPQVKSRRSSFDDDIGDDLRERLPDLVLEAGRPGEPLAVILFEIPGLAESRAEVRKAVRTAAADQLTEEHTLVGPDGDRLAALLPGETSAAASVLAERVRANVAPLLSSERRPQRSLSAGVAAVGGGDIKLSDLLDRAETALARAMEFGGDRVIVRDGDAYREGPLRPVYGRGGSREP